MSRDALVVGINTYSYLKPLTAPANDAEAIAKRLEDDGDFQMVRRLPEAIDQSSSINTPVVGETLQVSQQQLESSLKNLFRPGSTQAADTALFYFSGHGISDDEGYDKGYLATSETNPNNPRTGLSLRWVQWLLSESPVRQQIVWLDCCHSGGLLVNVEAANPGHGEQKNRCFIASSRDFESSWQDLNSPYSVLTKVLLDGLDPTRFQGRWVDSFAIADYVNQALKGELQKPLCTNLGDAINLTRTWQEQEDPSAKANQSVDICPYKGLEYFDCNDTDPTYFFGRDRLVSQLLDEVRTSNFIALVGASGNGKTSVLRAGLLHQIKQGRRITGSDEWRIRITRPDKQPMQNLALAFVDEGLSDLDRAEALGRASGLLKEGAEGLQRLIQASSAPRVILVVDQFEEVFTRCEDTEDREHYFACLMGALSNTDNKLCLIIAMRADFIGKCMEYEYSGLAQHIQANMVSVLPMKPDELKEAICKPAELVGLTIETTLITTIMNDIAGAPGSLPLLQYALKELFQQRKGNQLVLSTYQNLGGITGTLDKRATTIYNEFDKDQQKTVQHIFQQLTQLGEGTEDTRRRVFQSDLVAEPYHSEAQVQQVIETLSNPDNRLLVTSEVVSKGNAERMAIVDVAHEALIRHWKLLRQWVEKNRDLLRQQRKIEASAVVWREQNQKRGHLLHGLQLAEANHFKKKHANRFALSKFALDFVKKSIRWQRINRFKWIGLVILPAFAIDYSLHITNTINPYYNKIDQQNTQEERSAVLFLTKDCGKIKIRGKTGYLLERFTGKYCRTLTEVDLRDAVLSDTYLANVDLSDATLFNAHLRNAYLEYANLSDASLVDADLHGTMLVNADLSNASLMNANLSGTSLSNANLSDTFLFFTNFRGASFNNTDLREAMVLAADLSVNHELSLLSRENLSGENQPYLCNVNLPSHLTDIDPNRDCDILVQVIRDRYNFTPDTSQQIVEEAKAKTWD